MSNYPVANLSQDKLNQIKEWEMELNQKSPSAETILIAYAKK